MEVGRESTKAGTLYLHVTLNAIVDLDNGSGPQPYPIRTFDKPTPLQSLGKMGLSRHS
jgi:hypothetical protein